jgi:uncharacterized protein
MTEESKIPILSPLEARVLAVLVEKEQTVPDAYPLTLNALVTGCNQKTSRDPVMSATEGDVQVALDSLRRRSLAIESSGGRVMRYAQNVRRVLGVPTESVALLATLMLRGPQTAAELRINCERLRRFSDLSAVEGFLNELAEWSAGPLSLLLPRAPGARESRWMHLLCGPPDPALLAAAASASSPGPAAVDVAPGELSALKAEVERMREDAARMREEIDALSATVAKLCGELGVG